MQLESNTDWFLGGEALLQRHEESRATEYVFLYQVFLPPGLTESVNVVLQRCILLRRR